MICGLLGRKLGHSYSPKIHSYLGDYPYSLYEIEPDEITNFLRNGEFTGLNVTIPYKKKVVPFCDELSDCAAYLGAVNTIVKRNNKLIGHNTDYFGFCSMLDKTGLQVSGKKVLVLGSGGASATAVAVLVERCANVVVISRNGKNHYDNLHLHEDAAVIVNATPVGMYPNTCVSPVNLNYFPALEGVLDIIYNPAKTKLLMDAEQRGLITENGLWMLVAQAKESAEWFSDNHISDLKIKEIYARLRHQMENIVLIGMPGCGKSTLGALLAEKLSKKFVDTDDEIVRRAGRSIPEIFASSGEIGFRELESEILADLGKESGLVIATGGGCVTRPENYRSLHQNGQIIWIQRNIDLLPTDGRPISQSHDLMKLYQNRKPLYEAFSDVTVSNNDSIDQALCAILRLEGCL